MTQLRKLDANVTQKSMIASLTDGILGALILGIGMCCAMVWKGALFVPGVIIGIIGLVITVLAYPVNEYVTKKERAKVAPKILKLTDELIK